jgi:hypothetical protein
MSVLAWALLGLIVLGVIIALIASRRRDRDVVIETRTDVGLDRPLGTTESEIERERRRRAS